MSSDTSGVNSLTITENNGGVKTVVVSESGGGVGPIFTGGGVFPLTAGASYIVEIKTNIGNNAYQKVIYAAATINLSATIYSQVWAFASEDSVDDDFNDALVTLTSSKYVG